ncbi:serine hydrolase [bacterium]|nr:serine hydrolase [bacterium]
MGPNLHSAWNPVDYPRLSLRLGQLAGQLCHRPQSDVLRDLFSDSLQRHRTIEQLACQLRTIWLQNGKIVWLEPLHVSAENMGVATALTVRNRRLKISLTLELEPAGRITEYSCQSDTLEPDFDSILQSLKGLPGQVGLCCWELTSEGPREVISYQPEQPLSVASAYKLYVLGALAKGSMWQDSVTLTESVRSFPTGLLQHWPAGCPLSVQSLAALMISLSDNTAAEVLLHHMGKQRVESGLAEMGHSKPELLTPLLSSLDHLRLKSDPTAAHCEKFLRLDEPGRRHLLIELAKLPRNSLAIPSTPTQLEVGWWATPADLCRALAWLSRFPQACQVLQINPGLPLSRCRWSSIGFKGGSEPGVLAASWLLEHCDGRVYVLGAAWNNPRDVIREAPFFGLLESLIWLLPEGQIGPDRHSLYPVVR